MSGLTTRSALSGPGSGRMIGSKSGNFFRLARKVQRLGGHKAAEQLLLAGAQAELEGGGGIGSADSDMREEDLQGTLSQGMMESRRRAILTPGGSIEDGGLSAEGYEPVQMRNESGGTGQNTQQRKMTGVQGLEGRGREAAQAPPAYVAAHTEYDQYGAKEVPAVGTPPAAASGSTNKYPGVKIPAVAAGGAGTPAPAGAPAVAGAPAAKRKIAEADADEIFGGIPKPAAPKSAQDVRLEKLQTDTIQQVRSASAADPKVTRESALEAINKQRYENGQGAINLDWSKVAAADKSDRDKVVADRQVIRDAVQAGTNTEQNRVRDTEANKLQDAKDAEREAFYSKRDTPASAPPAATPPVTSSVSKQEDQTPPANSLGGALSQDLSSMRNRSSQLSTGGLLAAGLLTQKAASGIRDLTQNISSNERGAMGKLGEGVGSLIPGETGRYLRKTAKSVNGILEANQ